MSGSGRAGGRSLGRRCVVSAALLAPIGEHVPFPGPALVQGINSNKKSSRPPNLQSDAETDDNFWVVAGETDFALVAEAESHHEGAVRL